MSPEDRLGDLPNDLLYKILSLLPTKDAAKTSVLSKRWKTLFFYVSNFTLDGTRNIDEVPPRLVFLSKGIFRSETLVTMNISGTAFVIKVPDEICCPSLKQLQFQHVNLVNPSGLFKFAGSSYPLLEELSINSVNFVAATLKGVIRLSENVEMILSVSLTTLRKLVVDYDWYYYLHIDRVEIDAQTQHLQYFRFTLKEDQKHDTQVNFSRCDSLLTADVYQFGSGESYVKLLSKVKSVKTLRLSDHCPQVYDGFAGVFPQFINLTHLRLRYTVHKSVWTILQHAPNLEVLHYRMSYVGESYLPPENVPHCLSKSIREIWIRGYKPPGEEIESDENGDIVDTATQTARYFLHYGAVLGRMRLGYSKKTAGWRQFVLALLRIFRHSEKCEIELEEEE